MITYKEMVSNAVLGATAAAYYTTPTSTSASIHAVTVNNPTGAAVTVNLYRAQSAGLVGPGALIASRVVPAGSTLTLQDAINHKLQAGTQLFALGLGCGMNVSGVEYLPNT